MWENDKFQIIKDDNQPRVYVKLYGGKLREISQFSQGATSELLEIILELLPTPIVSPGRPRKDSPGPSKL